MSTNVDGEMLNVSDSRNKNRAGISSGAITKIDI